MSALQRPFVSRCIIQGSDSYYNCQIVDKYDKDKNYFLLDNDIPWHALLLLQKCPGTQSASVAHIETTLESKDKRFLILIISVSKL